MIAFELALVLFYTSGVFFNVAAVVGIIRLPDIYTRLHSSAKNTTLGSLLIVFGLAMRELYVHDWAAALKLLFIGLILLVVSPIASHALARAAYWSGVPLWRGSVVDEYAGSRSATPPGALPEAQRGALLRARREAQRGALPGAQPGAQPEARPGEENDTP